MFINSNSAGVAEGSISVEHNPFLNIKAHVDGDLGSVGGNLGGGFYYDKDDYILNIKLELGIALGLGVEGGLDLSFKFKPFVDFGDYIMNFFKPAPQTPTPTVIGGIILTGCMTVIIG